MSAWQNVEEDRGDGTPPRADISRPRKAAIIVRLLLSEGADLPLGDLPEEAQVRLTAELAALRYVDAATLRAVVGEFLGALESFGLPFPGGIDGALRLLDGHISAEAAAGLRARATGADPDPWSRLGAMGEDTLLAVLEGERDEIGAVILTKLDTARAARLLAGLPGERARRLACAVSLTAQVPPETVARIGRSLLDEIAARPRPAFATPPEARMGAILNAAPAATRDSVLSAIEDADEAFARKVRGAIFTFADIPARLGARDVPAVMRALAGDQLAVALKAAEGRADAAAAFLVDNMSKRMAEQLRADLAELPAPDEDEAEAAMSALVAAIRGLADEGEIRLARPDAG